MVDNEKMVVQEYENDKPKMISYYTYEAEMARAERHTKRIWILCFVIFTALILTNFGWILYEAQYEDVVMTQEATTDGGGDATVNGSATGDINYYGEGETDNQSKTP